MTEQLFVVRNTNNQFYQLLLDIRNYIFPFVGFVLTWVKKERKNTEYKLESFSFLKYRYDIVTVFAVFPLVY